MIAGAKQLCIQVNSYEEIESVKRSLSLPSGYWQYLKNHSDWPHLIFHEPNTDDSYWSDTHNSFCWIEDYKEDEEWACFDVDDMEDVFDPISIALRKTRTEIYG